MKIWDPRKKSPPDIIASKSVLTPTKTKTLFQCSVLFRQSVDLLLRGHPRLPTWSPRTPPPRTPHRTLRSCHRDPARQVPNGAEGRVALTAHLVDLRPSVPAGVPTGVPCATAERPGGEGRFGHRKREDGDG